MNEQNAELAKQIRLFRNSLSAKALQSWDPPESTVFLTEFLRRTARSLDKGILPESLESQTHHNYGKATFYQVDAAGILNIRSKASYLLYDFEARLGTNYNFLTKETRQNLNLEEVIDILFNVGDREGSE